MRFSFKIGSTLEHCKVTLRLIRAPINRSIWSPPHFCFHNSWTRLSQIQSRHSNFSAICGSTTQLKAFLFRFSHVHSIVCLFACGASSDTIIIKCSGNFHSERSSQASLWNFLSGKMCCFLLMTATRPSSQQAHALATSHWIIHFFMILHFNNRGRQSFRVSLGFFLCCVTTITWKLAASAKKRQKGLFHEMCG